MKTYARIDSGIVVEIIEIEDDTPTLSERYHAAVVESTRELKGNEVFTVKPGWNFDGSGFSKPPPPEALGPRYVAVATVRERMEAIGKWGALVDVLKLDYPTMIKVLTLREGIASDDPQARTMIEAAGANPDEILAP